MITDTEVTVSNPICVALDTPSPEETRALAASLAGEVGAVKVGLTSFALGGAELVRDLVRAGDVFLDLKLHDIPAQVEGAVGAVADLGVSITTVHASGGRAMLQGAANAAQGSDLKVVAVTVLTSLDDSDLEDLGVGGTAQETVLRFAEVALSAGVHGLVCSPHEVASLRDRFGAYEKGGPYLVVPGIRPTGASQGDQRRTLTPKQAMDAGADLLVVGRPITQAPDPIAAVRDIVSGL
jgi:orotidine-5'-phosphate decarboxylase